MGKSAIQTGIYCFHCGDVCGATPVHYAGKDFCCEGCRTVFTILDRSGMCNYYEINKAPGPKQRSQMRKDKFAFLDDVQMMRKLTVFKDAERLRVVFYLPQVHCSSCLWLLENLHAINPGVITSKVNFTTKEIDILIDHRNFSIRETAELLTSIGYEPFLSLHDVQSVKPPFDKSKIYKLGVAGFCFANIMLLSFPEYFGMDSSEQSLSQLFRLLNVTLSLPVIFYAASEFYLSAWKSLKHGVLNIDAPIALSVFVTFARSIYEVMTGTGPGYFDSMSGIVFFMLVGRVLQDKTWRQLGFERDYTSYFPVAATRMDGEKETPVTLPDIKLDDTLLIHSQELIPADGILTRGRAMIDYSFVTGESLPVEKEMGEIVYAGGRQTGANIEILVIKEVSQSYLTSLWNNADIKSDKNSEQHSFVQLLSRYFTWVVFVISLSTMVYWLFHDPSRTWNAAITVLIVACPCALLISNTFTNGHMLRELSRKGFFLKNAQVIENIAKVDYIVFDKTGTLTTGGYRNISYEGPPMSLDLKHKIAALASQSGHPLSKAITAWAGDTKQKKIMAFHEEPGFGIEGIIDEDLLTLGSKSYITKKRNETATEETAVYIALEEKIVGRFVFHNEYRPSIGLLLSRLKQRFGVAVLSGDNAGEQMHLQNLLGLDATLLFHQDPAQKKKYIKQLQLNHKVMMVGDGLNDAGALLEAYVGVAVTENNNNFTPASDAILSAGGLSNLYALIRFCKTNKAIVLTAFFVSVLYNIIGISYAVSGRMSPLIAAILMPCSSISILLITSGMSKFSARRFSAGIKS